jgi:hypothetical protein
MWLTVDLGEMDWRYMGYLDPNELEYLAQLKEQLHEQVHAVRHTRSEMERLRRRAGTRARRVNVDHAERLGLPVPTAGLTPSVDDAQLNIQ